MYHFSTACYACPPKLTILSSYPARTQHSITFHTLLTIGACKTVLPSCKKPDIQKLVSTGGFRVSFFTVDNLQGASILHSRIWAESKAQLRKHTYSQLPMTHYNSTNTYISQVPEHQCNLLESNEKLWSYEHHLGIWKQRIHAALIMIQISLNCSKHLLIEKGGNLIGNTFSQE